MSSSSRTYLTKSTSPNRSWETPTGILSCTGALPWCASASKVEDCSGRRNRLEWGAGRLGDGREGMELAGGVGGAADEGTEFQRGEGRGRTHSSSGQAHYPALQPGSDLIRIWNLPEKDAGVRNGFQHPKFCPRCLEDSKCSL